MVPGEAELVPDLGTSRTALNQALAAVRVGDADAAGRAMEQIIEDARIGLERATRVPE
jgi:DNA-binding FadR family transcriptional regulator